MSNSTYILGDVTLNTCLRRAGMMAIHAYNNQPEYVASAIRDRYANLMNEWTDEWDAGVSVSPNDPAHKQVTAIMLGDSVERDIAVVAGDSGYYARFYTPKNPEGLSPDDICPPVLAFRGSEQKDEEFRDLAATLTVICDVVARPTALGSIVASGHVMLRYGFYIRFDPLAGWERRTASRTLDTREGPEDHGTLWDVIKDSFVSEKIWYPDGADTAEMMRSRLLSQADFALPETQALINSDTDFKIRDGVVYDTYLKSSATVSAHYGSNGDWAANIFQGMGHVGTQYQNVKASVDRAAATAQSDWNGRLNITGHSLGGGLAAAASLYAMKTYPDLVLGAITYNAAGLHENTATEMAGAGLNDALALPVQGKVVRDEILNTLGVRGLMPFVSDIFRWQNRFMPRPTGMTDKRAGISPGLFPVGGSASHQFDLAPDGDRLPFLFPLTAQTMFKAPYVVNYRLPQGHAVGSGGSGPRGFEPSAMDAMADRAAGTTPDWGRLEPVGYLERRSGGAQDMAHMKRLVGMSASAPTFDVFIGNAVRYLFNEGVRNIEARHDIWNYLVPRTAGALDIFHGLSQLYDEVVAEGPLLGGLFAASGTYHPMDVAGSTFLRE
jgi:hypothetical protein